MLRVRVVTPHQHTDQVAALAEASGAAFNLIVLRDAVISPPGDLVEFDLVREGADAVLAELRELNLYDEGSIMVDSVDFMISAVGEAAEKSVPGSAEDAVVWDELAEKTADDASMSWSFLAFLSLATLLAGVGAVLDQPVMIVGAMVLGPEFGAIASMCFGIARREPRRIGQALRVLAIGFGTAVAVTTLAALAARGGGWIEPSDIDSRPLTEFFFHPDKWSLVVALLAGIAGMLAITSARSTSLVGVFISVATIPAAGNIGVSLALSHWSEVGDSAAQLGLNLVGLTLAGVMTLLIQQALWARFGLRIAAVERSRIVH